MCACVSACMCVCVYACTHPCAHLCVCVCSCVCLRGYIKWARRKRREAAAGCLVSFNDPVTQESPLAHISGARERQRPSPGLSPSSTLCVTSHLYLPPLSSHLEMEAVTDPTAPACCKNSASLRLCGTGTCVCLTFSSCAQVLQWLLRPRFTFLPAPCAISLSLLYRWGT